MEIAWKGILEFWSAIASFVIAALPLAVALGVLIGTMSWQDRRRNFAREQQIEKDHQDRVRREIEIREARYSLPKNVTPKWDRP